MSNLLPASRETWKRIQLADGPGLDCGVERVQSCEGGSGKSGRQFGRPASRTLAARHLEWRQGPR